MNLLECTQITKNEIIEFFDHGIQKLKELEDKNSWDFYVNDFRFYIYINQLFIYSFECYDILDYTDFLNYPKIKELSDLWDLILEDETNIERYEDMKRNDDKISLYNLIYQLCIDFINRLYC